MNQRHRYLSCSYALRENPKKKTKKSFGLESMKKILFRCDECGKGFRYEKCLSNHQEGVHLSTNQKVYEEPMKNLCRSFSLVRKKRSRVIRYKKTPLSCSFTTFSGSPSVFASIDEELEVAECLILLSKSSPTSVDRLKLVSEARHANPVTPRSSYHQDCISNKKPLKAGEFVGAFESEEPDGALESEFLNDEQKLLKEEVTTVERFKGPLSFLGHKCEFDQQKLRKGIDFGFGILSKEQELMEESDGTKETWKETASFLGEKNELDHLELGKSSDFESMFLSTELGAGAMECSDSDTEMVTESNKKNIEQYRCRLCNKIFSSYQALGGHQTFHRMSKSKKNKKNSGEESVDEPEDDSVKNYKKTHKCNICSRLFSSVHALGGHRKYHGKRQNLKTEDGEDLGLLSVDP